jgi:peptide deformylase
MTNDKILIWPDPRLKAKSEVVTDFGPQLQALIKDLKKNIVIEPSAGIAAPQIGVHKRVFIMDIPPEDNDGNGTDGIEVFVNPEFVNAKGSFTWEEGCLSIPGIRGKVTRHDQITMRYQNEKGEHCEREAFYYLSGCFQHELDHLNGILWVDHQSPLKRNMVKKKMLNLKKSLGQQEP